MSHHCCDHVPKHTLRSLDDALQDLLNTARHYQTECIEYVPLNKALNRILAEDIISPVSVPPSDNSAVDGYALFSEDMRKLNTFPVSQRIPAGCVPEKLQINSAARIFTGAPIPEGANCVVMQENTQFNQTLNQVTINEAVEAGQNIRPQGQDIQIGACILKKGSILNPIRLGLLASVGFAKIPVKKQLTIAIMSTGDELVEPGTTIKEGQIFNSNRYLLTGLLQNLAVNIIDLGVIPDNQMATTSALKKACQEADIVLTTGGASVGEEDYIQTSIQTLGEIDFWKVAIKPGKPFMLGTINQTPILGLPGNPGAVLVTFLMLARPFIRTCQGVTEEAKQSYPLALAFDIKKAGGRREFLRVRRTTDNRLEQHPNQSSGMLSSASWAEGLAVIMEGSAPKAGDLVEYIPFDHLF